MDLASYAVASSRADAADDRARAIARARRHSRHVRILRHTLEIGVLGAIVVFVALSVASHFGRGLGDVTFAGVGIEGGRITMDRPHLSGSRPDGGSYDITAVKAMQDAQHPGAVDLALIGGQIATAAGEVSRLFASSGHYESTDEALDLQGDVRLQNPRYEISLRSVHIAFKKGDYVSNEPVQARILPETTITADALAVKDGGAQASFSGHVRTLIDGKDAAIGGAP